MIAILLRISIFQDTFSQFPRMLSYRRSGDHCFHQLKRFIAVLHTHFQCCHKLHGNQLNEQTEKRFNVLKHPRQKQQTGRWPDRHDR